VNNRNILLLVSGGIAAYKSVYLLRMLVKAGASVQVAGTLNSLNFIGRSTWEALSGKHPLFDTFETRDPEHIGHITLAQDVDLIVVAPATANIIAKAATGIADDFPSTILAASSVPVLFAPGMNSAMYLNEANTNNIKVLSKRKNMFFIEPETGELACGTSGPGRMAEPEDIFRKIEQLLSPAVKNGLKWLVTGGATREYIDPVRYITNGSSGKTGLFISDAAFKSGGDVTFIGVNVNAENEYSFKSIRTASAADTMEEVEKHVENTDIFVMSAAIADYTVLKSNSKIKKTGDGLTLELKRTEDILLKTRNMMKKGAVRVGFAAETEDLEKNSLLKMEKKGLDMIVANIVSDSSNPFGSENNSVVIHTSEGFEEHVNISKKLLGKIVVEKALKIYEKKNGGKNEF